MYLPRFFQGPYVEDTFEVVRPFASSGQLCRQVRRSKDMAMGLLSGRVAIVTGAAQRGIGASYAKALAREGAKLCVSDIADCDGTVQQSCARCAESMGMRCDVTKSEDVSELVRATRRTFGQVDILVNNVAMFRSLTLKPFEQIEVSLLPDDLVGALLFLVGPQSDVMTGQTIVIDGRSVCH